MCHTGERIVSTLLSHSIIVYAQNALSKAGAESTCHDWTGMHRGEYLQQPCQSGPWHMSVECSCLRGSPANHEVVQELALEI